MSEKSLLRLCGGSFLAMHKKGLHLSLFHKCSRSGLEKLANTNGSNFF